MKKLLVLILALVMVLTFASCNTGTSQSNTSSPNPVSSSEPNPAGSSESEPFPKGPIILNSLAGTGTSFDNGLRLLLPYVEKELGETVNININENGGGWAIWLEATEVEPDGYNIYTTNFPAFFNCYNPELGHTQRWDDYDYLLNFCTDENALIVPKESAINTVEDFLNYVNSHDNTVVAVTPVAGDDHIAYLKLINAIPELAGKTSPMHGNSNLISELLGGFVDVMIGNVGNMAGYGDTCKCICVFSEKRSELLPDIPTFNEEAAKLGYNVNVTAKTNRGIMIPKGMDERVKEKLVTAFVNAYNNEEFKQEYLDHYMGWDLVYGDEYTDMIKSEADYFQEVLVPLLGWE